MLAALGAFLFSASAATTASAAPLQMQFDRSVINLGGPDGTWAPLIDPTLQPPDPPAFIATERAADGSLSAAAEDFEFPLKKIQNLATGNSILPYVDADIQITAEGPITGSFDQGSGAATVNVPADVLITVRQAGDPNTIAICRVEGFVLGLATAGALSDPGDPTAEPPRPAAEYPSAPFTGGDPAPGAVIASWAGLPASKVEGGSLGAIVCPELDGMLGGPGGVWLSGVAGSNLTAPKTPPTQAPKITGTPAKSTQSKTAEFTFEKEETESAPVTGFDCRIDGGEWAACDGGSQSYSGLAPGSHTFEVVAKNADGPGPAASYTWSVQGGKAKLSLKVKPAAKKVAPGAKATFTATVRNAGAAAAKGAKVCLAAPKKAATGSKCVSLGSLKAGASKKAKFKVKLKGGAKKAKLTFKASAKGAKAAKAKAKVTAR